ncbi:MAG: efflux RND transporter periplasmic adaptor subunit [Bacteroidetes bacterium]|nr:MAG: efflux RND transporter periplasmic adaptor subunit [Bacteroidota bacterium]
MKKSILSISILMLFCAFYGCKPKVIAKEEKKQFCLSDTMQSMIKIDSVRYEPINDELHLSGEVAFDENKIVKVFPNSSGQVLEVKVSFGDKVTAGQVLAVMKSADVAGNYNDLVSAEADLRVAKRQMDNQESLYKNGISSQKEYEEAKGNYEKAEAVKNKIESLIKINGGGNTQPGGIYYIKSPINGYIVEKKVNAGNFIRMDMSDNMFTISDLKDVWIWANVFETDIAKVKEGYTAKVTTLSYPDKIYAGVVDKISTVLDPTNKVLRVRVRLLNPDMTLKPEMFANIIITNTENRKAIAIPSTAIVEENGKTYVVVYNGNCDLKVMEVSILKIVGDKTYLNSGVQPGQKLLTHNALMIYDEFTDNQ